MSTIKLVMVDLDGTILINHKDISKDTEKTINYLLASGVEVVPTTGRFFSSIPKYFTEKLQPALGLNWLIISMICILGRYVNLIFPIQLQPIK